MNYITTEAQSIFKSDKEQTVVLEIWIECKEEDLTPVEKIVGTELNIWCGKKQNGETNFMMKDAIIGGPSDNDNADIVHQIKMKDGDEVMAYFSKDNILRYEFSDYDTWYAEERRKIDAALYGPK